MMILVYDTETTGLPDWQQPSEAPQQPHIVELAALLYDTDTCELVDSMHTLVRPDGWTLVPERIGIQPEAWEAAQFVFGGPGTSEDDPFYPCTLWVGEIEDDDGNKVHGLHVSCDECPEEGSVTLAEFALPEPPQ